MVTHLPRVHKALSFIPISGKKRREMGKEEGGGMDEGWEERRKRGRKEGKRKGRDREEEREGQGRGKGGRGRQEFEFLIIVSHVDFQASVRANRSKPILDLF